MPKVKKVKKYYAICHPGGECMPDILSRISEVDAWISFYHQSFNLRGKESLKEWVDKQKKWGYKCITLIHG